MLLYHTFVGEFSGETPRDIIDALYAQSAKGTGESFPAWWTRQRRFLRYDGVFVPHGGKKAPQAFLDGMVRIGALGVGPKVPIRDYHFDEKPISLAHKVAGLICYLLDSLNAACVRCLIRLCMRVVRAVRRFR